MAAKTQDLIELARKEAEPSGDLYCPKCDVFPNARGLDEKSDGVIYHKACQTPLDLRELEEKPAKPRKAPKAAKGRRKAKEAPKAPEKAPEAPQPSKVALIVEQVAKTFGPTQLEPMAGGWKVSFFVPAGA